jgi:DNA-binding FadR family transcriptional regulator
VADQTELNAIWADRIRPAYQQVADQLRDLVLQGGLDPGQRLPVEAELTEMFGVSRSTVREALRVLSSQNLVRTVRGVGGGSFVTQPDASHVTVFLQASLGLLSGSDEVTLDELLEAREMLEVPATRLAAERATDHDRAELQACLEPTNGATDELGKARDLHSVIAAAAHNSLLAVMADAVFNVLKIRYLPDRVAVDLAPGIDSDHELIVTAIVAGDSDKAAAEMKHHLRSLRPVYQDQTADVSRPTTNQLGL